MNRIHVIGRKNSGKTTLICELVEELNRRGYRVGTIKHTHHDHELDTPGKDSHRHRISGSSAVGILTKHMNAIFWPQEGPTGSDNKYSRFDAMMNECDVVLVEGDSKSTAPKIEVFRKNRPGQQNDLPLALNDATIVAVVSDDKPNVAQPVWRRSDLSSLVTQLLSMMNLKT